MGDKIKNNTILAIVILAIFIGGIYFFNNKKVNPDWKTKVDASTGVSFQYPEIIPTTYIRTVDWPPVVQVIEGPFLCADAGEVTARTGKTEERIINGHRYCLTTVTEGAAGSIYTSYAYAFKTGDKTLYFTFSLRSVECANYDNKERGACEKERDAFDIDPIIDQIIQTAKP